MTNTRCGWSSEDLHTAACFAVDTQRCGDGCCNFGEWPTANHRLQSGQPRDIAYTVGDIIGQVLPLMRLGACIGDDFLWAVAKR
jgi:hypothetical protein